MQTNFLLGTIKLTEEARKALRRQPYDLLARHAINEHGQVSIAELKENLRGMKTLGPIISRYRVDPTNSTSKAVVVKTAKAWSNTLIYLE
jgi:hypothetical protein